MLLFIMRIFQIMDSIRLKNLAAQQSSGFEFPVGSLVEVADRGKYWDAKVWKIKHDATDGRTRYFCRFPGHREWDNVISTLKNFTVLWS